MSTCSKITFRVLLSVLLVVIIPSLSLGEIEFHGFLRTHNSFRIQKPNDAMMLRNRFRLNPEIWGDNVHGFASFDVLNEVSGSENMLVNLREAYIDIYSKLIDLRIGKQQVVWGKADGYFINDIVNPLDLSYFLLQDFDDIRIATTMINTKLHYGNHSLELLVIPEFQPLRLNFQGDWGFSRPDSVSIPEGMSTTSGSIPMNYHEDILPDYSLRKAEYGFKLNTFIMGADLSLIYMKIREDKPVYRTQLIASPDYTSIWTDLTPRHPWLRFYGFSFEKPIGAFVFRGEGGYYPDRYYNTEDMKYQTDFMILQKDFVQGMLGMDYQLTSNIDIGVQAIHERILDFEEGIHEEEEQSIGSFLIRASLFDENVSPMLLTLYNFSNKSSLSRISVDWSYSDSFTITFGADILEGTDETVFGQFDRNDNIYMKVKFNF